jgi:superfamily II DNA helicase RecQ
MTTDFDDEFGLSSSDELEQAMADLADNTKKHARTDDVADAPPSKVQKTTLASVALGVATNVLNSRFKLPAFRLKQSLAISRILEGGSSVVVFPTGERFLIRPLVYIQKTGS